MEYGCEVWNGCIVELTDKLEKLQLEAARIVTGLPAYLSRDSLYLETEWEKLWIDEIGDITDILLPRSDI